MPDSNGRLTDEEFYKACQDYARKKGRRDIADDYASAAFLMRRSWPMSNMRQFWANYWRDLIGGSAKKSVESAIYYRKVAKTISDESAPVDFLENYVAAEERPELDICGLTPRQKMLMILKYAGFSDDEIRQAFGNFRAVQLTIAKARIGARSGSRRWSLERERKLAQVRAGERQHTADVRFRVAKARRVEFCEASLSDAFAASYSAPAVTPQSE